MKKYTAILLVLILMFSLSTTALAAPYTTDVTVNIDSNNISVTVPVNAIAITALVNGGDATVPSNYQIVNTSAIPIRVEKIAVAMDNTNWVFSNSAITAGTASTSVGKNEIFMSINEMVLAVRESAAPTNATSWNIAAGATKNLPIVCSTSQLNTTDTVSNLITITYVISAGTNT